MTAIKCPGRISNEIRLSSFLVRPRSSRAWTVTSLTKIDVPFSMPAKPPS